MKNLRQAAILSLCVLGWLAVPAHAHFVWLAIVGEAGARAARAWFSEGPHAGEPELIQKIAATRVWLRTADGEPSEVTMTADETAGELRGDLEPPPACSLEAHCDYGVLSREGRSFLLQYYARHIRFETAEQLAGLARCEEMPLDIVPEATPEGLRLRVLWQGQPAEGAQVVLVYPDDNQVDLMPAADGLYAIDEEQAGLLGVRARYVDSQPGERDGQAYTETRYYTTLTWQHSGKVIASEGPRRSAAEVLAAARAARAVWEGFTGFDARLAASMNGVEEQCTLQVTADGEVTAEGLSAEARQAAERLLDAVVGHRLGSGDATQQVSFIAEEAPHPLGVAIRFDDDLAMGSVYRIRDDVVTEVNRDAGDRRFTISVLDVARNAEGRYLPHVYQVSTWSKPDNHLVSTTTACQEWVRVGAFDLPGTLSEVRVRDGECRVLRLTLSEHRLLAE